MTASIAHASLSLTGGLALAIVGKATIVLVIGLVALTLASRARAAVRHLLMAATFGTVLILPLIISTVRPLTIEVPLAGTERVTSLVLSKTATALVPATSLALETGANGAEASSIAALLFFIWAAGTSLLVVLLANDLRRLRILRRGGLPWSAKNDFVRSLAVTSGVSRPVEVLLHEHVTAPLTCGLWRPVILLPIDAEDWHEGDLRRALVHELEHVRRGDWVTQLLARLVCACYWFHPLVWMAWGRLRLEAERACDDAVLQCAESAEYAEQLVSLAKRMSMARARPSLAMANRTDLSARVIALLDRTRRRGRVGYAATATVVSVACVVMLLVTSIRAIASPSASRKAQQIAQASREDHPASQISDRSPRGRGTALRQTTGVSPKPSPRRRAQSLTRQRAKDSPEARGKAQGELLVITPPIGGSAGAERTVMHSSTGSASATHSASASSSSN